MLPRFTELKNYIDIIDKEIARKREEFKLETLKCKDPGSSGVDTHPTLAAKRLHEVELAYNSDVAKADQSLQEALKPIYTMMAEGIDDMDAVALSKVAAELTALNAEAFKDTVTALNKAVTVLNG